MARKLWSLIAVLVVLGAAACQKREEPVPSLTQDQWRRVNENLLDEEPEVSHPVDAVFEESVRLIGWNIEPQSVEAGEDFEITFYWEVLEELDDRWHIFVHLDANMRQNLDHEAVQNIYPTVYWEQGQIIQDSVRATLSDGVAADEIAVFIGFWRGEDRMTVNRAGAGTLEEDGRLRIGSFDVAREVYPIRRATGRMRIDGRMTEAAWRRAEQTDLWVQPSDGSDTELESWGKILWDDEHLYVGMYAEDPDILAEIATRDGHLWEENEVLEFYFDGMSNGQDYLELQINPHGAVFDAQFPRPTGRNLEEAIRFDLRGIEAEVYIDGSLNGEGDDDFWSAELKIPLESLTPMPNVPPNNGDQVRINFYRFDTSSDDSVRAFAWSPNMGGSFHQPDRFALAAFEGAPANRPPPRPDRRSPVEGSGAGAPEGSGEVRPAADGSGAPATLGNPQTLPTLHTLELEPASQAEGSGEAGSLRINRPPAPPH